MVVDDDKSVLVFMELALKRQDYAVDCFSDPVEALEQLKEKAYQLVISDYVMKDVNGVHMLEFARQLQPACARILLTSNTSVDMLKSAINKANIFRYIEKLLDPSQMLTDIEQALEFQKVLQRGYAEA